MSVYDYWFKWKNLFNSKCMAHQLSGIPTQNVVSACLPSWCQPFSHLSWGLFQIQRSHLCWEPSSKFYFEKAVVRSRHRVALGTTVGALLQRDKNCTGCFVSSAWRTSQHFTLRNSAPRKLSGNGFDRVLCWIILCLDPQTGRVKLHCVSHLKHSILPIRGRVPRKQYLSLSDIAWH